jgi:hypothetical protein
MPRKTDAMPIDTPFMDRRVKMLPCQKEQVPVLHSRGASIHSIARMYRVNKRLIQFILFPDRQKLNLQHRRDRGGSQIYYNRIEHNAAIKEHRDYKKEILKGITN